jgi:hypothetical protein
MYLDRSVDIETRYRLDDRGCIAAEAKLFFFFSIRILCSAYRNHLSLSQTGRRVKLTFNLFLLLIMVSDSKGGT